MQRCLLALASESDETSRRSTPASRAHRHSSVRSAGAAGTARWRKCGPAAEQRANGVAYSADIRASGLLRRLPEVLPRGLRRLWDGAPCPITLAQFPARQHLAGKIRFSGPALYYNYPLFTRSDAPFGSTTERSIQGCAAAAETETEICSALVSVLRFRVLRCY